jgi:hypothetical protein
MSEPEVPVAPMICSTPSARAAMLAPSRMIVKQSVALGDVMGMPVDAAGPLGPGRHAHLEGREHHEREIHGEADILGRHRKQ